MKKTFLLLTLLGGLVCDSKAVVSGPDNIVYGTITLGGTQILATDTNFFVAARFTANGPAIATYTMGSLPSAGNYYSLRVPEESVGQSSAPNATKANQLIYIDVDDQTGVRAQTSFRVGPAGTMTLLNFGTSSFSGTAGSLSVNILPPAVVAAGAKWQVDGGTGLSNAVTATNLTAGVHTVTFTAVTGWATPVSQVVTVTSGVTKMANGIYTQPNGTLTLLTNGYGAVQHSSWPAQLLVGSTYTVTAIPSPKNVFVNWVGGTNQPYSTLTTSASYTFTMQSNLVLEANFVTNVYTLAKGTYRGLFSPTNTSRVQTNSGAFLFTVSGAGIIAGHLDIANQMFPLAGKIDVNGGATIISKAMHGFPALTTSLQLDFDGQSVNGAVTDGSFIAPLNGNRDVFSGAIRAGGFVGQYTMVIPGTTNAALGPFGTSYAVAKVSVNGSVTMNGSLADGTPISQSSVVSQDGYWPLYISLYGGKGSLWGWNNFANHTLTAPAGLSWINMTNASHAAVYRSGFTNQGAPLTGGIYSPVLSLPGGLVATLQETNPPFTLSVSNFTANANALTIKTNKASGVVSGAFANPDQPTRLLRFNGVILQGQTNAQGYFLNTNQSGTFNYGSQ